MTPATEQALAALDRANESRMARAELKRALRDGELTFREAIEHPDAQNMVVWALLKAKRGLGHTRLMEISTTLSRRRVTLGYHARIGSLTERQKLALLNVVESRGSKPTCPKRLTPKPKRTPRPPRPGLIAAREAAQVDVENPPPRCSSCNAQLLMESLSGLCRFCEIEQAEDAA